MDTETMIRELRNLQEKHKNDQVFTFGTRWADVCRDVADRLEGLSRKDSEPEQVIKFIGVGDRAIMIVGDGEYNACLGGVDAYNTSDCGKARTFHKFSLVEI